MKLSAARLTCLPDVIIPGPVHAENERYIRNQRNQETVSKHKNTGINHSSDEEYILSSFQAGADGYCLKSARFDEVLNAMKTILSGKPYMSGEVSAKVLTGYLEEKKTIKSASTWKPSPSVKKKFSN